MDQIWFGEYNAHLGQVYAENLDVLIAFFVGLTCFR